MVDECTYTRSTVTRRLNSGEPWEGTRPDIIFTGQLLPTTLTCMLSLMMFSPNVVSTKIPSV